MEQKRAIFDRYRKNLDDLPLTMQPSLACACSNRWLSTMLLDRNCGRMPAEVLAVLNEANIEGRHLWKPMHSQPVFSHAKYVKAGEASVSEELFSRGICLPSDTKISMDDVDHVCKVIREMF